MRRAIAGAVQALAKGPNASLTKSSCSLAFVRSRRSASPKWAATRWGLRPWMSSVAASQPQWVLACRCFSTTRVSMSSGGPYVVSDLDAQTYQKVSDLTMDNLTEYLEELVEDSSPDADYDVEYSVSTCGKSGVLTFKVGDKGTYVINKQPPNRQIWLSSPTSGPKRYDYDSEHKVWFYHRDGTLLRDLLNEELRVAMNDPSIDVRLGLDEANKDA